MEFGKGGSLPTRANRHPRLGHLAPVPGVISAPDLTSYNLLVAYADYDYRILALRAWPIDH